MTDAHCHVRRGEGRRFICDPAGPGTVPAAGDLVFRGWHPWFLGGFDPAALRAALAADARLCVGEIGLDRLKSREIPSAMRAAFEAQLALAAEFGRPVALHGAKCWGEVVKTCRPHAGKIPAFLFHGFSRSGGLLSEMEAMNGFVSVGPALLNDHAVNYRELARAVPERMLLVESDATEKSAADAPPVESVAARLAELRGLPLDAMSAVLESNADRFAAAAVCSGRSGALAEAGNVA